MNPEPALVYQSRTSNKGLYKEAKCGFSRVQTTLFHSVSVCLLEPSYMDVCPPDDLQKPVADLFSIDGSLLERPPSKAALLWGVAPRQLGDLADTNTVAQLF